jgi:hypothetical protein
MTPAPHGGEGTDQRSRGYRPFPGHYTYEVQTVRSASLSPIDGTFKLNMEGYDTELIEHNESAISFKQKLESLHTI